MPVTKTGRNVESLVTELSEVRTQLDGLPARYQETISGLLASVRAELTEHRDRFIGVLRAEQTEAAKLRKDNSAQQHRIEELLADLAQARLDLAQAGHPGHPDRLGAPAAQQQLVEPDATAAQPGPGAFDEQDLVPVRLEADDSVPGPAPDPTTITTSTEEPAMTEPTPRPGAEDVPPAVRDYIRQVLAEQLHASPAPQEPAADTSAAPEQARTTTAGAPLRPPAGGTSDLIPPTMAWPAHVATLRKASAVHKLVIACHPHTWDFLAGQVRTAGTDDRNPHFTDPAGTDRDQRRDWERGGTDLDKHPDTVLSGRSAVALLNALHTTVHRGLDAERSIETWSLAVTAYERIAEVVNATRPGTGTPEGPDNRPRVVLDDRSPGAGH
ncbi:MULTISPECIES: hypothetical protein [unclassified Kitasatospora]|uniref:hypothetical protein n=1 Tax=unclassified Kitasatospora TaxID=2633591 RepID=UPI0033DCEB96